MELTISKDEVVDEGNIVVNFKIVHADLAFTLGALSPRKRQCMS